MIWSCCHTLQKLIDICYEHSCKWRYKYNPIQCSVVIFNEPKRSYNIQHRYWKLGSYSISETEDYTHLGINSNIYSNQLSSIESSSRKLRSTLMSLVNVGICKNGLNPVTSYKIYKCIVMHRALYGCEIWQILNNNLKSMVEKSHRFCLKFIQCIPKYTRTDICVAENICFQIEQRKLFFWDNCVSCLLYMFQDLYFFIELLYFIMINVIPPLWILYLQLLDFLDLDFFGNTHLYLLDCMQTGLFPYKHQWKTLVRNVITVKAKSEWYSRMLENICPRDFISLKSFYSNYKLREHCSETIVIFCNFY